MGFWNRARLRRMVWAAYNPLRYGKEEEQIESFQWEEKSRQQKARARADDGGREPKSSAPL